MKRMPPQEWTQPARALAFGNPAWMRTRLDRVLGDARVLAVLPQIEAALGKGNGEGARQSLLFVIGSGGGWQPTETEATRAKRRGKIAKLARELSETMADDPGCERFTIEHLWAIGLGIEPVMLPYEGRSGTSRMPRVVASEAFKWTGAPTVGAALAALATAIDRDLSGDEVALHVGDRRPDWQPFAAQPGRAEAPQSLLERALCEWFDRHTGAPHPEFVAPLVEVTLELDTVDPNDLSRRWRKFKGKT